MCPPTRPTYIRRRLIQLRGCVIGGWAWSHFSLAPSHHYSPTKQHETGFPCISNCSSRKPPSVLVPVVMVAAAAGSSPTRRVLPRTFIHDSVLGFRHLALPQNLDVKSPGHPDVHHRPYCVLCTYTYTYPSSPES